MKLGVNNNDLNKIDNDIKNPINYCDYIIYINYHIF